MMGTIVSLVINNVTIDVGKNRNFQNHYWLFNSDQFTTVRNEYYFYSEKESKALINNMNDVKFRLNIFGYSYLEIKEKFNQKILEGKSFYEISLPFELFESVIIAMDLSNINDKSIVDSQNFSHEGFIYYIVSLLMKNQEFLNLNKGNEYLEGNLAEFLEEKIDVYIILRILCQNKNNLKYNLKWLCFDIIESGWTSIEEIKNINMSNYVLVHNKIYGILQKYAIQYYNIGQSIKTFDQWLSKKGFQQNREYIKENMNSNVNKKEIVTVATFIRNIVHHPENSNNSYSSNDLKNSINQLINILKKENVYY